MSEQEQEPQPEHMDTLDVLAAIVDAWRHMNSMATDEGPIRYQEYLQRREGLEKALEMGRRHLEQEGRL